MLFAFLPLLVLDGMLDIYTVGLHMWEVPKEPFVLLMEEEPRERLYPHSLSVGLSASSQRACGGLPTFFTEPAERLLKTRRGL